jgi:hypothetical protein
MREEKLTENLLKLMILEQNKDNLTEKELNEIGQIMRNLTEKDREQMIDILAARCMPWILEKDRISAEDIESLNRDKQYFTKSELLDMIGHELDGTFGKPDFKALWQMIKSLLCHKYYKTVEEAESHYQQNQKGKTNQ